MPFCVALGRNERERRSTMAVRIRLTRRGGKNDACFRIVASDKRSPRDGRFLEILGWYDPRRQAENCSLKLDRIEHWEKQGATLTDTVRSLVKKARKAASAQA